MRISDWSSDVCSSDLFSCANCALNFAVPVADGLLVTGDLSLAFSNVSFSGAANSAISSYRGSRITLQSVALGLGVRPATGIARSEEHPSELQSLMRISYAVLCLKKKTTTPKQFTAHSRKHNRSTQTQY